MPNEYDKILKENLDAIYLAFSRRFIKSNFLSTEELNTDIQRTKERKTDFLRKLIHENPNEDFILHIEVQTKDDHEMLYRMQEYHAMLLRKYRMRIFQMVFYIGEGISKMKNSYQDGKNSFSFELVSIQEFSYKQFLETEKPEELILAILADFENNHPEKITGEIFRKAKMITNETFSLEKFVNQFEVISKLRNLGSILINKTENIMPLDISVEDLYSYQIGKQAGIQEGIREGIKDGEQKGLRKAKDEMIVSMIKKAKLSLMEIAEIANVSLAYVKNLAKKINE